MLQMGQVCHNVLIFYPSSSKGFPSPEERESESEITTPSSTPLIQYQAFFIMITRSH